MQGQSTKGEEGHWLKSPSDSPPHSALTPAGPQYLPTAPSHPCLSESQETGRSPCSRGPDKVWGLRGGQQSLGAKARTKGFCSEGSSVGPDSKGGWESPSPLNSCETEASHHSSRTGTHLVSCLPTGLSPSAIICKEGRKSGPCPGMASKSSWSKGSFQFYLRFQPFV